MSWSDARVAAAGEVLREQRVRATVGMAGRQRGEVTVQHAGTPEAAVTVRLGRVLVYLHTAAAARRFAQVWRDGQVEALLLARHARRHPGPPRPPDVAEPSLVVHVAGTPAATRRLVELPGQERADHLVVRIDELRFAVYDRYAFQSCAEVFATAARAAAEHLPRPGRLAPKMRPNKQGAAPAETAIDACSPVESHPARAAAAALRADRSSAGVPRRQASSLGIRRPRVAGIPAPGQQPGRGRTP